MDDLEQAWENFLQALKTGDIEKIRLFTTKEGFACFERNFQDEDLGVRLSSLGLYWEKCDGIHDVHISKKTQTSAEIKINPASQKEHTLIFKKEGGGWRLDYWSGRTW